MRKLILTTTALIGLPFAAFAVPTLTITAADSNSGAITLTCAPSNPATGGTETCLGSNADFSSITINATGVPLIASPDLATITVTATSATTLTAPATLSVDVTQTGLSQPGPLNLDSTFTVNDLINGPFGPTTLSDSVNGAPLASHTFLLGDSNDTQRFLNTVPGPITSDAHDYAITFTAGGQVAEDSIELQNAVPEPATLSLLGVGLLGLGFVTRRRQS